MVDREENKRHHKDIEGTANMRDNAWPQHQEPACVAQPWHGIVEYNMSQILP